MERKLRAKRDSAIYQKRSQRAEPVFGQIKPARKDRISRRGLSVCVNSPLKNPS